MAAVFTLIGGYVGDRIPIRWAILTFSAVQPVAVGVKRGVASQGGFEPPTRCLEDISVVSAVVHS